MQRLMGKVPLQFSKGTPTIDKKIEQYKRWNYKTKDKKQQNQNLKSEY